VCDKQQRQGSRERFTALLHHVTVDLLRDSFYALKRKAAPGVDGVTWQEYETGLEDRLVDLHSRVHRGAYRFRPAPVKDGNNLITLASQGPRQQHLSNVSS
jgi:hypothetical protein